MRRRPLPPLWRFLAASMLAMLAPGMASALTVDYLPGRVNFPVEHYVS